MTFVSGADAGHLAAFCADGDSKDDVVFYSPSGLSPFAGNFDGDVSGGYGLDDLFVYAPGSGSDDMWWGGSRTDFGTAASAKGLAPAPMSASYGYDVAGLRSSSR